MKNFKLILRYTYFVVFIFSCREENVEINQNYIKNGCIPKKIKLEEPILGGREDEFYYDNNVLTGFGSFNYIYNNGLVKEIWLGSNRYEEYRYNDKFNVIQSIQYRKDTPDREFKIVVDKKYSYKEGLVYKVIDNLNKLTHEISYFKNTNNIDSIKSFNSNSELIELKIYEYDNANNVYKNLLLPKFNFYWWVEKNSDNNVKQQKTINFENTVDSIIYKFEFKYNEYNYPFEIIMSAPNPYYTSKTTISYTNCE